MLSKPGMSVKTEACRRLHEKQSSGQDDWISAKRPGRNLRVFCSGTTSPYFITISFFVVTDPGVSSRYR